MEKNVNPAFPTNIKPIYIYILHQRLIIIQKIVCTKGSFRKLCQIYKNEGILQSPNQSSVKIKRKLQKQKALYGLVVEKSDNSQNIANEKR